jgi:CheY-like chemotaxis protein
MAQVISNLLNNAAKYTDPQGKIRLSAERIDAEVVIGVQDNGIGIPADLLPSVFEIFTQGDQSLSRSRGGLGIGLTLVRSLVEMHGGRVAARSNGPGQGSEFLIHLPVAPSLSQDQDGGAGGSTPNSSLPRQRILVVDDNRSNAQSLATLLRAMGQEVHTAFDGLTALELLRRRHPRIVLLDIGLPVLDGYEVARRCREQPGLEHVVLVALTGYGQESDRQRSREAGFDAHLVKPVSAEDLRLLLSQTVSGGRIR